jgi:hypothetical protein
VPSGGVPVLYGGVLRDTGRFETAETLHNEHDALGPGRAGNSVLVTDIVPGRRQPGRAPRRPARRLRWITGVTVGILFAAALGYVVTGAVKANDRYDRAHAALSATERQTRSVSSERSQLHAALALLSAHVASDSAAATQDTNQLKAAQTALADLEAHVTEQTALIGSLQACLGGVERALNALSVGRPNHAIAALEAVTSSCQSAAAVDG